jgi:hypothetical protein
MLDKINAVSFADVNNDGHKDIIIIAEYMTGFGKEGAIPFAVGSIYFQKDKGFKNDESFDEKMNSSIGSKNMNISSVIKYAKD